MYERKKVLAAIFLNLLFVFLIVFIYRDIHTVPLGQMQMRICYGEYHSSADGGTTQLFYTQPGEAFSEERSFLSGINEDETLVFLNLPDMDINQVSFRLDPFMNEDIFSISSISIFYQGDVILYAPEDEINYWITSMQNCVKDDVDGREMFVPQTSDAAIYFNQGINQAIVNGWEQEVVPERENALIWCIILYVWSEIALLYMIRRRSQKMTKRNAPQIAAVVGANLVLVLGISLNYGVWYLIGHFGNVGMGELIFYLKMPLDGTNVSTFDELILAIVIIAAGISALVAFGAVFGRRIMNCVRGYALSILVLGCVAVGYAGYIVNGHFDLVSYWNFIHEKTTLYEENYADARDVELTFPEQKRNLVYIFMESMETTYASQKEGGGMETGCIPLLEQLAMDNIDFSCEGSINGAHPLEGATYTSGAIVAQTAGVPINATYIDAGSVNEWHYGESGVLPGAWTIGDILAKEGYKQEFLIGSDGTFGGRSAYMSYHGGYEIKDYITALEDGWIPEDYYEWWGFEDEKLFTFAKKQLQELAESGQPFNLTLLTADTHFTDGYLCRNCKDEYDDQYSNVIACSDRQVTAFVKWIQQQDFYENTTIVLAGDHLTMDSDYISRHKADNYDRRSYFTIIHPVDGCMESEREREYSTFDIYPTTLAAMGVMIDGDQLGLGVNLFSEKPTLYETYGADYLNGELIKTSKTYQSKLMTVRKK